MKSYATRDFVNTQSCNCIGPRNGEPLCHCMMRGVFQRNGRWIRPEQDLGPVQPRSPEDEFRFLTQLRGDLQ